MSNRRKSLKNHGKKRAYLKKYEASKRKQAQKFARSDSAIRSKKERGHIHFRELQAEAAKEIVVRQLRIGSPAELFATMILDIFPGVHVKEDETRLDAAFEVALRRHNMLEQRDSRSILFAKATVKEALMRAYGELRDSSS